MFTSLAFLANQPRFTQIAYQVTTDADKQNYRKALAEYTSKIKTRPVFLPSSPTDCLHFAFDSAKLFRWLKMNLNNKAENFMDQNLKWIFLLNNAYKISKQVQDSNK